MKSKKSIGKIISLLMAGMMTISGLPALEVNAAPAQPGVLVQENGGAGQEGSVYYVASGGSDENSGTLDKPFRTIQKATEVMVPGDTCYVREGIYDETVSPAVNGTAEKPITIKNYQGESVTVSGCQQITGWIADEKEGVFKAPMDWSLGENGDGNQVFVNGTLMYEARYPNVEEGSTLTNFNYAMTGAGTGFNGTTSVPRAEESKLVDPAFKEFAVTADFFDGAKIWMVPGSEWTALTSYVKSYDPSTGTIIYPSTYRGMNNKGGYYNPLPNRPYYIFGAYGLLDAENEWWYSKEEQMLYVKIAGGENPDTAGAYLEAKKRSTAFDLSSCAYINIDGINTRGATVITDADSTHLSLRNMKCEYVSHNSSIGFESLDSNASPQDDLGILIKGSFIEVDGCEISNSSGPLINIQGSDNTLVNCYIHDGNYIGTYAGHSKLSGRRQFISNNTMCESGRDVVSFRNLAESVVQYNNIYGAGSLTKDVGVMYTAETDGQNTLIHHNFIHDNHTTANSNGFYLDEMSSNFIVFNNSMWNAGNAMCVNHPSMFNLIYNNTGYDKTTVSDTYTATFRDDRGRQYINNYISGKRDNNPSATATFYKNNQAPGLADAKFADVENHDFRISEDSALAGAGIPVSGVTGDNPSIGAYEPGENYKVGHDFENPPVIAASPDVTEFEFRNLIRNGGFEYGNLENWNGGAQVVLDTAWHSTARTAATCFYGAVMQPGQSISQTISVEPGTLYTLSLLTRSREGSSVTFGAMGVNGNDVMEQAASTGSTWGTGSKKTMKFQTGEKDTSVTISITNDGEKELYLDDVGVQKDVVIIKDISGKISTETNEEGGFKVNLEAPEEGHKYYYSDSVERQTQLEAGMMALERPEEYKNELTDGMIVLREDQQYLNIVETVGNQVIGIASHLLVKTNNIQKIAVNDGTIRGGSYGDEVQNVAADGQNIDSNTAYHINLNESTSADYKRLGYMQFDLTDIDPDLISDVKLKFYVYKTNSDEGAEEGAGMHRIINIKGVSSEDWDEDTLTWNNALSGDGPLAPGDLIGMVGDIYMTVEPNGKFCEADITGYIREKAKAGNSATVQLSPLQAYSKGNIFISTKENPVYSDAEYKPQLIISYYGVPADLDALKEAYLPYKDLEQGSFTEESWAVFVSARNDVLKILENPRAVQSSADKALAGLKEAFEALKDAAVRVTGVVISSSEITVEMGKQFTLSADILPENATNKNVLWSSSDERIAAVNENGLTMAVSSGDAVITVTTEDGGFTDTCAVTVEVPEPEVIPVEEVLISETQRTVKEGETFSLTATVSPGDATNQSITWSSSDNETARVSDGIVTAVKEGIARILATSVDGGHQAECVVTVESAKIPVDSISISDAEVTLKEGETYELTATVSPGDAADQSVTWSSSVGEVASVTDGHVEALSEGVTEITVTAVDGGHTATCRVTVQAADPGDIPAEKWLLQKTYDYAKTLDTAGVAESVVKYFNDALLAAEGVLADPDATKEDVRDTWKELVNAIHGLGLVQGDKETLRLLADRAEGLVEIADKYVAKNWQTLLDALKEANAVLGDGDAMAAEIKEAEEALLNAILIQRLKANKDNLYDLISKAGAVDESLYTEESVQVFRSALAIARAMMEDENLSEDDQPDVDKAAMDLGNAMDQLEKKEEPTDPSDPSNPEDPTDPSVPSEPDTPSEPEDNGQPDGGNDADSSKDTVTAGQDAEVKAPKTGDNSPFGMMAMMAGVGVLCVGGVLWSRKKKDNI